MRRIAVCLLVALLCSGLAAPGTLAAPAAQATRAVITSPSMNAVVRGKVLINGSAVHPSFWKYEVHFAPEPNTGDWNVLGVHETQVIDGVLETWDTATVPDGRYSLRLRVVDRTGNYQEYFVRGISVSNTQPTETPTLSATRTPTRTPTGRSTALAATATAMLAQPTVNIAAATPTPTLERPTRGPAISVPTIETKGWADAFLMGAGAMAAIFLLVGLVFLIRRLL